MITNSSFTPTHKKIFDLLFFWRVVSYPLISPALILLTSKKSSNVKNFKTFVYTSLIKLDCIQAATVILTWYGSAVLFCICCYQAATQLVAAHTRRSDQDNRSRQAGPRIELRHFFVRGHLFSVKVLPLRCRIENLFSAALAGRQLWRGNRAHGGGRYTGVAHTHTTTHFSSQLHV